VFEQGGWTRQETKQQTTTSSCSNINNRRVICPCILMFRAHRLSVS